MKLIRYSLRFEVLVTGWFIFEPADDNNFETEEVYHSFHACPFTFEYI
jgi:hypothetical protein